jgi:serine/threonine protein kinase/Tfp pilus assembly protein PilF
MDPHDLQALEEAFNRASGSAPPIRERLVHDFAQTHPMLASALARMLQDEADLSGQAIRFESDPIAVPAPIGNYRPMQLLGSGGFGVVYLAQQTAPVERLVAMKFVWPEHDSGQVADRFRAERQVLAALNHPCIPRLLDTGALPSGQSYLVMPYIAGLPVTTHCSRNALSIEARLRLMARICDAVAHAHARGVQHRDIKPSNVLVTQHRGWVEPKLIDFGISRIIRGFTSPVPSNVQLQSCPIGTPAYMAPEQWRGQHATHRSDLHALGVLLYELLTDRHPFRPQSGDQQVELLRQRILEDSPPPPSRVSGAPAWGDLDLGLQEAERIDDAVMCCLAKDPEARSISAAALSELLRSCAGVGESHEEVPAAIERAQTILYEGHHAEAEYLLVEAVSRSKQTLGLDHALTLHAECLLGVAVQEQGRPEEAEPQLRRVLEAQSRTVGAEHPDALRTLAHLALCVFEQGRTDEAEPLYERALAQRRRVLGSDHPETLVSINNLGSLRYKQGRLAEAADCFREAADKRSEVSGKDHPDTLVPVSNTGSVLVKLRRYQEAEPYIRQAADGFARLGPDHPATLLSRINLANLLGHIGSHREGVQIAAENAERSIGVFGPSHANTKKAVEVLIRLLEDKTSKLGSEASHKAAAWRARAADLDISLTPPTT